MENKYPIFIRNSEDYYQQDFNLPSKVVFFKEIVSERNLTESVDCDKLDLIISNDTDIFRGIDYKPTLVSKIFFSSKNIEYLQKKLIYEVFRRRNIIIPFQDEIDLKIIMRNIYTTFGEFYDCGVKIQINDLDNHVINKILPGVLSNVDLQINYQRIVSNNGVDITPPLPIFTSKHNTLSLFQIK